jgi:hypothetical protein
LADKFCIHCADCNVVVFTVKAGLFPVAAGGDALLLAAGIFHSTIPIIATKTRPNFGQRFRFELGLLKGIDLLPINNSKTAYTAGRLNSSEYNLS